MALSSRALSRYCSRWRRPKQPPLFCTVPSGLSYSAASHEPCGLAIGLSTRNSWQRAWNARIAG